MLSLNIAITTFLLLVYIFFVVFSYICLLWTTREKTKLKNIMTGISVSLLYSFQIVLVGTMIFILIQLADFVVERFT